MLLAIAPLVVMLVGLLIYVLADGAKTPKLVEIGRILFFVGALVLVWALGAKTWRIG